MTKEELIAEGALILEQEGWLINRVVYSECGAGNGRMRNFSDRYTQWQVRVNEFRDQHPGEWPVPEDNS
jgi:hypothetical protein